MKQKTFRHMDSEVLDERVDTWLRGDFVNVYDSTFCTVPTWNEHGQYDGLMYIRSFLYEEGMPYYLEMEEIRQLGRMA